MSNFTIKNKMKVVPIEDIESSNFVIYKGGLHYLIETNNSTYTLLCIDTGIIFDVDNMTTVVEIEKISITIDYYS